MSPLPPAVLWVPRGRQALTPDDWWEGFHAQLYEENEADCAFLQRLSRCPWVLEWGERVEDIPADWFAVLAGSPRRTGVDTLPFQGDETRHLQGCGDCHEEVYERMQQRAEGRWEMFCPSVEEIAAWLEVDAEDPRLEAHIVDCRLCQETVQRQAWLWEGA